MPPLPAHFLLLLLLLLLLAASASAASFTCVKPGTCQSAVIGYVVPYATTYEELLSLFSPATLRDLVAANQLPPDTATKQAIPPKKTLTIPFRCRCTGNGMGQSNLYTARNKFDDGSVTQQQEIVSANHIADNSSGQKLWIPLPCSCDKVDGANVTHFAYVVRSGDNSLEIATKYGVPESTLLRTNNITKYTILRQGQIVDIPLQGMVRGELSSMGRWSRVHYISGYRKRRLGGFSPAAAAQEVVTQVGRNGHFQYSPEVAVKVVKAIFIALLIAFILSLVYFTFYYGRSACKSLLSVSNGVIMYDYGDLALGTYRFSKENRIGEGKFGEVYKATIKGQDVAVKKLKTEGNSRDFHDELQTISKLRHTNLVRLMGWCARIRFIDSKTCWKRDIQVELLIVFEWIPNGTLGDHLRNKEQVLPWDKRYKIVKGIGSALHYLHHKCKPCILHRDIKPDNILLDNHFNAKLADFGLSKITCKNGATMPTWAAGTSEYMDPQYKKNDLFNFNSKLDIYSFGLVLLDIACAGKREKVRQMYGGSAQKVQVDAVADNRLHVFDRTEMERVIVLGLKCTQPEEAQRPSMEDAMKFLENGVEVPATQQKKRAATFRTGLRRAGTGRCDLQGCASWRGTRPRVLSSTRSFFGGVRVGRFQCVGSRPRRRWYVPCQGGVRARPSLYGCAGRQVLQYLAGSTGISPQL